jgi:hypothetical protein
LAQVPALHQRIEPHCPSVVHGPHAVLVLLHAPFAQLDVVCVQAPLPLQLPTGVSVPLEQLCVPHEVDAVGITQVSDEPSHEPTHAPEPVQADRDGVSPVRGAPVIVRQVPGVSLHDWHCPVQSSLQQ